MDVKENGGLMPKICTDCTKGGAFAEKRDLQKSANGHTKTMYLMLATKLIHSLKTRLLQ